MRARKQAKSGNSGGASVALVELPAGGNPDTVNGKSEDKATPTGRVPAWEFLADEERDRDGTGTWLYRLHPVIDRKQGEHAICKKKGRFTRDDILREFGSGVYQIQVNNHQGKQLYNETISFHNPDLPPRLDPLEVVVGDPRNDVYFATWGKRPDAGDGQGKRETAKGETAEILRTVYEHGKVDPALVDMWKETSLQRDQLAKTLSEKQAAPPVAPPEKAVDILAIINAVKGLQPQPQDPLDILEKLKSFFPAAPREQNLPSADSGSAGDSLDQLKRLLEVFGQAKELFKSEAPAVAASPDADLWERIALNISNQVANIVNVAPAIIMAIKTKASAAPPMTSPPATAPAAAPFDPYRDTNAMRDYVRAQTAATPQAGAAQPSLPPEPSATGPTSQAVDDGMVAQVVSLVSTALSCMNRGIDGHAAAESIINLNGDLAYETVTQQIRSAGVPAVVALAKGIPEISAQITAFEEPLKRFLGEFLEGPQWEEEEDGHAAV